MTTRELPRPMKKQQMETQMNAVVHLTKMRILSTTGRNEDRRNSKGVPARGWKI